MAQEKELFGYNIKTIKPKGKIVYEYNPLYNYRPDDLNGEIDDLITTGSSLLNFDLEHPVDIVCQKSYDGSINLILNDNKNLPRLINTRFTAKENNTYERIDRTGNTDTNLYDESEFEIDTSLLKKYINIPKVNFSGVFYGGNLQVGNYTFYFKLSDGDGNETDIVAESGVVTIHMGSLNDPASIRGGLFNENSGKSIQFIITNLDSGYDYVSVYYSRTSGADNLLRSVQAVKILNRYRIRQNVCSIHITGNELSEIIPVETLSQDFFLASAAKTQEVCLNMLFLGNVQKYTPDYETLVKLSLGFIPYYKAVDEETELGSTLNETYNPGGYYNVQNIYNKVGYWNEEIYRFGVVYIMSNGSLSPVYNIRGRNNIPDIDDPNVDGYDNWDEITVDYDTQLINNFTLENSAGVCRIFDNNEHDNDYFQVRHFIFKAQDGLLDELKNLNIKGYFFVRQKRIPTILCQAFMIGKDSYSGIPAWFLKDGNSSTSGKWVTESFLDSRGYVTHEYGRRLMLLGENHTKTSVGICPEFEMNQAYYNNIFTGGVLKLRQVTSNEFSLGGEQNHIFVNTSGKYTLTNSTPFIKAKVTSVPDSGLVRDGNNIFRNVAGSANENTFQYLVGKTTKPRKKNFDVIETNITFTNGLPNIPNYIQEHKVKIARGLYSPYLGIYNTNLLKPNSLVNIYIPGYDTGDMQEYFKIRINCEDSYYPVSPRTSLDEFPENGEHVYRGDCFISQFTHRINRNFLDPDAPCNDTIVEEDTWREKYDEDTDSTEDINRGDLNAVRIGTYLTMKCYSSINLAMRDWDGSFPSEEALTGNKRSFYPLSSFRVDGHGKIPESVMFNLGFNATTGERMNFLQPPVPYIKNIFQTRVIYSDIAQTDAFKNGFRVFKGISYVDYSNQYGGITKLVEWRGNLIIVFEHGVALAAVNEKALIPTDDGTLIAVGAIKPLATTPVMISTDFGSQWPESICKSDNYIYGVDTVGKKIWRTDGTKLECISDFKVLKFLNENITLSEKELTPVIGVRNVKTHYNAFKHDVMFTYYDNTYGFEEKVWNLCWNELQQAFVTFYSWIPSYSANIDNIYFTYDRNSSKWITKLSQSTYGNENASGVCMESPLIEDDSFQEELHLANRPLPDGELNRDYYLAFELIRDNFGFWKYFDIVQTKVSGNVTKSELKIKTGKYNDLLKHWFLIAGLVKDPIIPCVQLNIRCNLSVVTANSDPNGWSQYQVSNAGYYESQVFLTLKDIYENTSRVRNEDGRWVSETLNTVDVYTDDAPTPDPPTPELPYIELEYIESNGTQYINTNVKVKSTQTINTKVKGLGNYSSSGSAHVYFGGRNHNTANVPYFELMSTHNNRVRCSRNNSSDDFYNINWGTELDVIISPTQIKINDDIRSVTTPSGSLNQDIVLCTIQMSGNSLDATPYCSERIYYFKIYDNNDCILNLIPVKRRSDNVVCMYDIQSGEFFTNAGTGNFIAGPEVQQEVTSSSNSNTRSSNWTPDWRNSGGYIESSGTQYIDSGVSSLGFRIECKLNVIGSNLRTLIGSYDTNKCNFVRIDGSNKICVAIGSTDIIIRENFQQNTDCIIDVSNISGSIFYKLNGNTIASSQNTYSDGSYYNGNIFIGANNISNNSAEHLFQGKIYYLKLYNKTGTLVREMYPAIVNNVPCMYDYVTDTYFYNQGTGNFTVSQEVIDASIEPTPSGSITVQLPTFETKFWKHGFAGLIDAQDKIRPCFWYGKQHPFEFEYVVGNDNAGYKQFDNLQISSNNVAPESIHYTIIGDSYDFSLQKSAMYFRQEATKALYQYNGSDLLYDHAVFDPITGYLPQMITSSDYIERDRSGNPLRGNAAVSTSYKDTLFPIIYMRLDTFNEVEDFYKRIIASLPYSDYPNITGGEILWDLTLDLFSICNHVKCRDIKEVGRSRGNIQYVNDKWNIQISPLIVLNRNNTWLKKNNTWLPKLVLANVPKEVYDYTQGQLTDNDFPPEISNIGYDTTLLDGTSWDSIANKRTEVKLLDKVLKTKIRYKGDKLVIVLATATSFNTIA